MADPKYMLVSPASYRAFRLAQGLLPHWVPLSKVGDALREWIAKAS
jgi:hypothetical protein